MKKQIVAIIQDIKDGENIDNYLLILAALVVAVLSLIGLANEAIIASVTLTVLSLIIYGQIKSDRVLRAIKSANEIQGIKSFYADRITIPPLESRIRESKEEIAIMGLQLGAITHSYLPLLKQQAIRGCKIKLLMMSPVDKRGKILPWIDEVGRIHTFVGLYEILQSNIIHLTSWLNDLPTDIRTRIEVKLYCTIPTASILLIDKDSDKGSIKVEPVLHNFSPSDRPSFVVERSSSPILYNRLVDSFNNLWGMGVDIAEVNQPTRRTR